MQKVVLPSITKLLTNFNTFQLRNRIINRKFASN
nr:MAG TPA: hypothetical protein [Caudoviricetes sp.]